MPFCGSTTGCVQHGSELRASRLRCRSWQCDECFPRRLSQLRDLAAAGYPDAFLTLTTRKDSYDSPDAAAQAMVKALRHLMQWIRRSNGWDRIQYLAVFEEHKSGWPHLHVLLRMAYVPQDELSAEWYRLTGSPIIHIRRVNSQRQASRYIAKYASKGPGAFDGVKRYWRTQGYVLDPALAGQDKPVHDGPGWMQWDDIETIGWWYSELGWNVCWDSEHHWTATREDGLGMTGPPQPAPQRIIQEAHRW